MQDQLLGDWRYCSVFWYRKALSLSKVPVMPWSRIHDNHCHIILTMRLVAGRWGAPCHIAERPRPVAAQSGFRPVVKGNKQGPSPSQQQQQKVARKSEQAPLPPVDGKNDEWDDDAFNGQQGALARMYVTSAIWGSPILYIACHARCQGF